MINLVCLFNLDHGLLITNLQKGSLRNHNCTEIIIRISPNNTVLRVKGITVGIYTSQPVSQIPISVAFRDSFLFCTKLDQIAPFNFWHIAFSQDLYGASYYWKSILLKILSVWTKNVLRSSKKSNNKYWKWNLFDKLWH